MRNRRLAQCWQVNLVQCTYCHPGCCRKLSVLYNRSERRGRIRTRSKIEYTCTNCKVRKIIPTTIEFLDIAGLVAGASKGEGLGNQFLGHIRETDAIAHVVRCFDDENIIHANERVDPISDLETITTELILADLETAEKAISKRSAPQNLVIRKRRYSCPCIKA